MTPTPPRSPPLRWPAAKGASFSRRSGATPTSCASRSTQRVTTFASRPPECFGEAIVQPLSNGGRTSQERYRLARDRRDEDEDASAYHFVCVGMRQRKSR